MQWVTNQYHPLSKAHREATSVASELLHSYPLTSACLEILGNNLLSKLEFGFFSTGQDIILQGESGKDLFLFCNGNIDVFVNSQVVVAMEGPTLLGDKAIVEPNSTRAATIKVAQGDDILVIKIPMGLFIRNFSDKSIPESEFSQEVEIYCNVFLGIQQRLFNYIYLQKKLWEEVNTTLNLLNSQMIAKSIDNQKDMGWDDQIWESVKKSVAKHVKFNWPDQISINPQSFREVLYQVLEKKFQRTKFKGSDSEYLVKKHHVVRGWLMLISQDVTKEIPADKLPFYLGDIELFNPRNYHMRMSKLFRSAEKKFTVKKQMAITIDDLAVEPPHISSFFGKGDRTNEFELQRYLASFENTFSMRYPKRITAQLGQRSALITAECENQFNSSVARMQKFLEKAKSKAITAPLKEEDHEINDNQTQTYIDIVLKSFNAYNRQEQMTGKQYLEETVFVKGLVPTFDDLYKCIGARSIRTEFEQAFQILRKIFITKKGQITNRFLKENLFLCDTSPGDVVPFRELKKNYWMPISQGIMLMNHSEEIMEVQPGTIIGGGGWKKIEDTDSNTFNLQLKTPEHSDTSANKETYLFFVFPASEFSWENENKSNDQRFKTEYLPIMQWMIDKQTTHLSILLKERDQAFQKWSEIVQIINLEKKIKDFEENPIPLNGWALQNISQILNSSVGFQVEKADTIYSKQLTKKIYNHILRKMGKDFPNMDLEQRGNKSYTKWRYILSEVVTELGSVEMQNDDQNAYSPTPVFELVSTELEDIAKTYLEDPNNKYAHLSEQSPSFRFTNMMLDAENTNPKKKTSIFKLALALFETQVLKLILEKKEIQDRLEKIQDQRPQQESDTVKLEMIKDNISRFFHFLKEAS